MRVPGFSFAGFDQAIKPGETWDCLLRGTAELGSARVVFHHQGDRVESRLGVVLPRTHFCSEPIFAVNPFLQ
jgi:hypothetical protein